MGKLRYIGVFLLVFLCGGIARGQKFSVSTNLVGYLNFATLNGEFSTSLSQHWSIVLGVRYNPWTFNEGMEGKQFQFRQQCYSVGTRYWLWHTYSGWWISGKVQYQEYNMGGLVAALTEEGDRYGFGASAGYTYMLHPRVNVEFSLGLWGGLKNYTGYSCPSCGITESSGVKAFVLPDNIAVSLCYVF